MLRGFPIGLGAELIEILDELQQILRKPGRHDVAVVLSAAVPPVMAGVKGQLAGFAPNYAAYLATLVIILIGLIMRQHRNAAKLLASAVVIVIALNLLPLMKRWTTFFGPHDSYALTCRETIQEEEDLELNRPRYFVATGTALMAANMNIYPRMRLVQGFDSLVAKQDQKPMGYMRKAGVGKVILNPSDVTSGIREEMCGTELRIEEVGFPECIVNNGNCNMRRVSPERIEIAVNAPGPTNLIVAETYHSAWRYRINKETRSRRVQITKDGFMSIQGIPAGTTNVVLFYSPRLELLGTILTIVSFITGFILILWLNRCDKGLP